MFQNPDQGAGASTPFDGARSPSPSHESVRLMLFGSTQAVLHTIKLLHKLNYAEPNDWSKPIPTEKPREVMSVLTKKVRLR
ncbi:MAG: hypothetical protein AAGD25_17050 [Cyanobacteria bacterium P01_F01_bin.150]